ncbi:hypothetical protein HDE_10117 [Halotydeus destructor]|nr:hypothetical protein HDE_10117 [Halotydeus destructor]
MSSGMRVCATVFAVVTLCHLSAASSISSAFLARKFLVPFEGFRSVGNFAIEPIDGRAKVTTTRPITTSTTGSPNDDSIRPREDSIDVSYGLSFNGNDDNKLTSGSSKTSLFSSQLNVLDSSPEDTQLAHSVLLVKKNAIKKRPATLAPIRLSLTFGNGSPVTKSPKPSTVIIRTKPSSTSTTTSTTTTASTEAAPSSGKVTAGTKRPEVYANYGFGSISISNHRPGSALPKRPAFSWNRPSRPTPSTPEPTSTRRTFEEDSDEPVIMKSNHRKYALPVLSRQKVTSSPFTDPHPSSATWSTTPTSLSEAKSGSSYPGYLLSTMSSTSISPFSSSIVNVVSRPPLRVTSVSATKKKEADYIHSGLLTVLDPPPGSHKLHPNTTIVHKNVVVPYKPGRPRPVAVTTTQFPVNQVLAGVTRWPNAPNGDTSTAHANDWPAAASSDVEVTTYYPGTFQRPTTNGHPPSWTGPTYESVYDTTMSTPWSSSSSSTPSISSSQSSGSSSSSSWPLRPGVADLSTTMNSVPSITQSVSSTPFTSTINMHPSEAFTTVSSSSKPTTGKPKPASSSYPSRGSGAMKPAASQQHFAVTHRPSYQSRPAQAATANAILIPNMPSRPISTAAPIGSTGIISSLMSAVGVESAGGIFSRLTVLKTALFTLLVMFLPPLTLAAAVAQLL